jgi:hypothetical protein
MVSKEGLLHARFGGPATAMPNFEVGLALCRCRPRCLYIWKARVNDGFLGGRRKTSCCSVIHRFGSSCSFDAATKLCADYNCMLALIGHLLTTTSKSLTECLKSSMNEVCSVQSSPPLRSINSYSLVSSSSPAKALRLVWILSCLLSLAAFVFARLASISSLSILSRCFSALALWI